MYGYYVDRTIPLSFCRSTLTSNHHPIAPKYVSINYIMSMDVTGQAIVTLYLQVTKLQQQKANAV